ncbi:DUF445 domain-containing protein [Chryseomicrobium palamuruense]|uniref:DUF445 domain-containing protein n=1 Tax=Chryseomicrobium palamuruense TaxID=682973 RepID=A0ABV8USI2_9BACL
MSILLTILFMAVIGAIIGAFTNHIAIKMLFRPYEAKYIGSWRVPFTPGLIPKRREELATQLGKLVIHYLLTPELIERKYLNQQVRDKIEAFIHQQVVDHAGLSETPIEEWLERAGVYGAEERIQTVIEEQVDYQSLRLIHSIQTGKLSELMPESWIAKVDANVPEVTEIILQRGQDYFASEQGKQTLKQLVDDFLVSKGTFGNMVLMMVGDSDTFARKLQPEISKFLTAPNTKNLISGLLIKEWNELKERPLAELLNGFDAEPAIADVKAYLFNQINLKKQLGEPITRFLPTAESFLTAKLIPKVTNYGFERILAELPALFEKLKLDQVVKEQVNTFPVSRLEELVLGLSRREFKMITILGGLLGGLIGVIQGIIAILLNS